MACWYGLIVVFLVSSCLGCYGKSLDLRDLDPFLKVLSTGYSEKRTGPDTADGWQRLLRGVQKKSSINNVDVNDVITMLHVTSSGVQGTGTLTVEASFPYTVDYAWITHDAGGFMLTKGDAHSGGRILTTSIEYNIVNEYTIQRLSLLLSTGSFFIYLSFDGTRLRSGGRQKINTLEQVLDAPNAIYVSENGEAMFDVTIPRFNGNATENVDMTFTYTDGVSDSVKNSKPQYELTSVSGTPRWTVTLREVPQAANGFLMFTVNNVDTLDESWDIASVMVVQIIETFSSTSMAPREFVSVSEEGSEVRYLVDLVDPVDDVYTIKYGSVLFAVYGNPTPAVEITRDGQKVEHHTIRLTPYLSMNFVPLDGKSLDEAEGEYACLARSGDATDTRSLSVNFQWLNIDPHIFD